jgi:ribosomal protein S21
MAKPVHVEVVAQSRYTDENERLIKKFSRKVKKNGVLDLVKKRRYYEKPSAKRKRKREKRLRLAREATKKHNDKLKD